MLADHDEPAEDNQHEDDGQEPDLLSGPQEIEQVAKRAAACAFCGSVLEVERPADPVEEAEDRLPFTVDSAAAHQAYS